MYNAICNAQHFIYICGAASGLLFFIEIVRLEEQVGR